MYLENERWHNTIARLLPLVTIQCSNGGKTSHSGLVQHKGLSGYLPKSSSALNASVSPSVNKHTSRWQLWANCTLITTKCTASHQQREQQSRLYHHSLAGPGWADRGDQDCPIRRPVDHRRLKSHCHWVSNLDWTRGDLFHSVGSLLLSSMESYDFAI